MQNENKIFSSGLRQPLLWAYDLYSRGNQFKAQLEIIVLIFCGITQHLQVNAEKIPRSNPQPLPYKTVRINFSLPSKHSTIVQAYSGVN